MLLDAIVVLAALHCVDGGCVVSLTALNQVVGGCIMLLDAAMFRAVGDSAVSCC